jgi:hypothetical protein
LARSVKEYLSRKIIQYTCITQDQELTLPSVQRTLLQGDEEGLEWGISQLTHLLQSLALLISGGNRRGIGLERCCPSAPDAHIQDGQPQ